MDETSLLFRFSSLGVRKIDVSRLSGDVNLRLLNPGPTLKRLMINPLGPVHLIGKPQNQRVDTLPLLLSVPTTLLVYSITYTLPKPLTFVTSLHSLIMTKPIT